MLYQYIALLSAAKYDELDENIPMTKDLNRAFIKVVVSTTGGHVPSLDEVIEAERKIMKFF